jgi:hypothetical protein
MTSKRIVYAALIVVGLTIPCHATKSMMFNSINQYIERATGIWIVEVLRQSGEERGDGPVYEAKILHSLKGDQPKELLSFCAIFQHVAAGKRYLVFGFNKTSGETWLDNGNISPLEIPPAFSLPDLDGKPTKEQILALMNARLAEIDQSVARLNEVKRAIEYGIAFQKRLDSLPGKEK